MADRGPLSPEEARERGTKSGTGQSELTNFITGIFESFKTTRIPWEYIWEECWYNYLGQYQSDTTWRKKTEGQKWRSRIFIKLTTLKCNTAHSKIVDVLFSGRQEVPFDLSSIFLRDLGITPEQAADIVKAAKERLRDHFRYVELQEIFDTGILEMAILGTAVMKGPIIETRKKQIVRPRMIGDMRLQDLDPEANPFEIGETEEIVPVIDHVPLWEYYTDINAISTRRAIGEIHFQRLLPAQFKQFAYQGGYIAENVKTAATQATMNHPDDSRYIQLGDNYTGESGEKDNRVSALEYQGLCPVGYLEEYQADLSALKKGSDESDYVESLVVLGGDGIPIKATLNPLGRRQYFVCPYKKRPHVIYGMGVAEMMRDSQKMVNSSARLYVDNKALVGSGMVAVNVDRINMKRTKNLDFYVGKTWYTKGQFSPKEAIDQIQFRDNTMGLKDMIEMFERFSDEETGIPKYTSGQQDTFLNKTAQGMSMLMTQANINLKTVMMNIDDNWIEPIVESFYSWFTEMDDSPLKGIPVKIKATGADSLMAKEIKIENLLKTKQALSNPQDAIFIDNIKFMKAIFRLLETEDIMRTDDEIKTILEEMKSQALTPKDLREMLDIDRLFPLLTRFEQMQVLMQIGIQPDKTQRLPITGNESKNKGEIIDVNQ